MDTLTGINQLIWCECGQRWWAIIEVGTSTSVYQQCPGCGLWLQVR